jgi:hypothetical protein
MSHKLPLFYAPIHPLQGVIDCTWPGKKKVTITQQNAGSLEFTENT